MSHTPSTTEVIGQVVEPVRPSSPQMKAEPALTVGKEVEEEYQGKDNVKLIIAGLVVVAAAVGVNVAPEVPVAVENIINGAVSLGGLIYAWWRTERTKREQSQDQAAQTREEVYSPASVEQIVAVAKRTQ